MSSKKHHRHRQSAPVQEQSTGTPWLLIAVAVAVVAGVGIMAWGSFNPATSPDEIGPETLAATETGASALDTSLAGNPDPAASSPLSAAPFTVEGPNDLPMPPLPYTTQMSGPTEQVQQAYVFAAQNPGVLEYVPCYCGCELDGHRSNVDCFVEARASNGAVESWDTHGMT
jgi:hypothetical protein